MNQTSSIATLTAERDALDKQIEAMKADDRKFAIARLKDIIADQQLTKEDVLEALGFNKKVDRRKQPAPAKFRDPASGKTWAGRGMKPRWMMVENAESLFAIKE